MVVYCKMTPVAVTAVKVVCMEEQTAQVCVFFFTIDMVYSVHVQHMTLLFGTACMCRNGGSCNGSACACSPGYTGVLCEAPCPTSCPAGYYQSNCSCGMSNLMP